MLNKITPLQFSTIATIFIILGSVVVIPRLVKAQSSPSDTQPPELKGGDNPSKLLPGYDPTTIPIGSLIPPSGAVKYVVLQPGEKITGRLGLPAAQLIDPPAELAQEIAVWVPDSLPKDFVPPSRRPDEIFYEIISSTRYQGGGHTIFVTTARPSPGSARFKFDLGEPDKLADGTTVGVKVDCNSIDTQTPKGYYCVAGGATRNQVQYMRGNLIITVASDLPIEQVKALAKNASLKNPSNRF